MMGHKTCSYGEILKIIPKLSLLPFLSGGGRVVRWCWVNFQCWGILLIWIEVGQGPYVLAVRAGKGCLDIFFLSSIVSLFFLPPSGSPSGRQPDID